MAVKKKAPAAKKKVTKVATKAKTTAKAKKTVKEAETRFNKL